MKLAWFDGTVYSSSLCIDDVIGATGNDRPVLRLLLVPDDYDLRTMRGDDWNDAPADCNAGEPYPHSLPSDHRWVALHIGSFVTAPL